MRGIYEDDDEIRCDDVATGSVSEIDVSNALMEMSVANEVEQSPKPRKSPGFIRGLGKGVKTLFKSASFTQKEDERVAQQKARLEKELRLCRHPQSHKDGGLINTDIEGIKMSRSVVAEIVKQVGKKILSGQNLMSVTFPVRCCQPRTILECAAYQFVFCPHYLTKAATAGNPVERLKQVVCCFVACLHTTSQFVKPFNPTLGETLQFSDGSVIDVGFSMDRYNNVYWGDVVQELVGGYQFRDSANGIQCEIELNPFKELPSDVFVGTIDRIDAEGEIVENICQVEGSWLGYLNFDSVRYWDFNSKTQAEPILNPNPLPSDSRYRSDRNALANKNADKAQAEKTIIEERQRRERRLRAAARKAKESGGRWDAHAAENVK